MIVIGLDELTTLGTTTSSVCNGDISKDELVTTLATSLTSALAENTSAASIHAEAAREYISSMSEEEIDDLLLKIDEKEFELNYGNKDNNKGNVKVKRLVPDNNKNNNKI